MAIGYGLGAGDNGINRRMVETVHGVRLNPYMFVGAGVGFNYYSQRISWKPGAGRDRFELKTVPVFVNLKGYIPDRSVRPFVSMDAGYGVTVGEENNMNGLYLSSSAGVLFDVPYFGGVAVSVGYRSQGFNGKWRLPASDELSQGAGAVVFKVAFVF